MGLREFLHRADAAVQDTRDSVTTAAVIATVALAVALVALALAVNR